MVNLIFLAAKKKIENYFFNFSKQSSQKKILRILEASQTIWPDLYFFSHPQHILKTLESTKYSSSV